MEPIIAYCGLVCSECPGYIHTQTGNRAELDKLAAQAREEMGIADATAESVMCDGCLGVGRRISYCAQCGVRACALARGVLHCAVCPEYSCTTLDKFLEMVPSARATLDSLRS